MESKASGESQQQLTPNTQKRKVQLEAKSLKNQQVDHLPTSEASSKQNEKEDLQNLLKQTLVNLEKNGEKAGDQA